MSANIINTNKVEGKIAYATKWSSLAEIAAKLILPIVNMALARILSPEAFGLVASVNIIISFAEIFQDAGFQKYMIQHEFQNDKEFDESANVAFWSNLILSIALWVLIICFRNSLALYIGAEGLGSAIAVASISLPIFALCSIQTAYYKRQLEFKKLFLVRIITSLIPLLVTVPLALVFRNYWALIVGTIARNIIQAIALYVGASWRPRRFYNILRLKHMISFCVWTLLESTSIWITANAGVFIVTKTLGIEIAGFYKTSIATVSSIISIISAATVTVLFAALSRVQNDDSRFQNIFFNFQSVISILVLPMGAGMCIYRELLTKIMLGSQWSSCAVFIGIYSLANAFAIVTSSFFSELYRAKGKPKISMLAQVIYLVVLIPAIAFSAKSGFAAVCVATTIGVFYFCIVNFCLVRVLFQVRILPMLKNFGLIAIPTGIMSAVGVVFIKLSSNVIWQFISIILCILIYFTFVLLIKPLREILKNSELTSPVYSKFLLKFKRAR